MGWSISHEPREQISFGKASHGLRTITDELLEFHVEFFADFGPALPLLERPHAGECLHELLNHPQDVVTSDHAAAALPQDVGLAEHTELMALENLFRHFIVLDVQSKDGFPVLMRN